MRRLFAPLVVIVGLLLGGCGPVVALPETPQAALTAAAQNTGQLTSVKYDFTGTIALKLPPSPQTQVLGLANGTLSIDFTGTGESVIPDRSHMTVAMRMASISATTETILIGATAYVKNPMSGRWTATATVSGTASSLTQADPLSYAQILDTAQSITDLGDTTLGGVAVHHYRVLLDKTKLLARLQTLPAYKDPKSQEIFRQIMDSGSLTLEVWFGTQDHLVRRIGSDTSVTLGAGMLSTTLGGTRVPAGTTAQMTEHTVINYHDFNAPVTVTAPSLG